MPVEVHANLSQRPTMEIIQPGMKAAIGWVSGFSGTSPGFEEMRAARPPGPQPIRQMGRGQGLIAMN
jgi:hypothetical protein